MTPTTGMPFLYLLIGAGAFLLFLVLGVLGLIQSIRKQTAGWIILACLCLFGCIGVVGGGVVWAIQKDVFGHLTKGLMAQTVSSPDGSMEAKVPILWKPMPHLNELSSFSYGNGLAEEYMVVIVSSKANANVTLEEFTQQATDNLEIAAKNAHSGPVQTLTVDQQPALQRRISGTVEGVDVVYKYTVVEAQDSYLRIICWTLPSHEITAFKAFNEVLGSFHVKGPLKPKTPEIPKTSSSLRVVQSKHKKFQIAIPEDWIEYPGLNDKAELGYGNGGKEEYMVVFEQPKSGFPADMTLAKYRTAMSESGLPPGSTKDEVKSLTIVGRPALQQRVTAQIGNVTAVYQSTCVEFPNSYIHVLCWTIPSHEAEGFSIYDRVLQTLQPAKAGR